MTCVFELTRSLVDIESISGNEMEAASFPSDLLPRLTKKYQGRAERIEVETRRCNVFASWGDARGTRIVVDPVPCSNVLKSVACKRDVTIVNIRSNRMLMAHGFLRWIFEVFNRFETAVDMVSTSEVSVSLTVDDDRYLPDICCGLAPFTEVSLERKQAIRCAVGENIRHTAGVAARVFQALEQVNVRMISQGASRLNLGVGMAPEDLPEAVEALHREFFTNLDPAVFD